MEEEEPPPPMRTAAFSLQVRVPLTPEEKIYIFNYYSSKWAAGQWAFSQLGAICLSHSEDSATSMGVQAAGAGGHAGLGSALCP